MELILTTSKQLDCFMFTHPNKLSSLYTYLKQLANQLYVGMKFEKKQCLQLKITETLRKKGKLHFP
jgi:hypothetical protein